MIFSISSNVNDFGVLTAAPCSSLRNKIFIINITFRFSIVKKISIIFPNISLCSFYLLPNNSINSFSITEISIISPTLYFYLKYKSICQNVFAASGAFNLSTIFFISKIPSCIDHNLNIFFKP